MNAQTENKLYHELRSSYDKGFLSTGIFLHVLAQNNLLERYIADFIGMVNADLPYFEAYAKA